MEYVVQAIKVGRNLVHVETNILGCLKLISNKAKKASWNGENNANPSFRRLSLVSAKIIVN